MNAVWVAKNFPAANFAGPELAGEFGAKEFFVLGILLPQILLPICFRNSLRAKNMNSNAESVSLGSTQPLALRLALAAIVALFVSSAACPYLLVDEAAAAFGWRGDGTGRFAGATPPLHWSATRNVKWSVRVGAGYASPVLTEKLVLVAAEPNWLLAVERATGKIAWKKRTDPTDLTDEKSRAAAAKYSAPKDGAGLAAATPVTDGRTVFMVFANGIVRALDLAGNAKWSTHIDAEPNTGYGRSASPVLAGGRLLVHITHLHAFDPASGRLLWANTNAASLYGTPVVARRGDELVVATPAGDIVRVADGRTLAAGLAQLPNASPLALDDTVIFAGTETTAVQLVANAKPKELWTASLAGEVFASPVVHDGVLFTVNSAGQLFLFNARGTGEQNPLFEPRFLFGENSAAPLVYASLALAGKHLFVTSTRGETVVLEATREAREVARNTLGRGTGASPVFSGGEIFLRDGENLFCVREENPTAR